MLDLEQVVAELVRTSPLATVMVDALGEVVSLNDAACALFECAPSDVEGRPFTFLCVLQDDAAAVESPTWCTTRSGHRFLARVTTIPLDVPGAPCRLHVLRTGGDEVRPRIEGRFEEALLDVVRAPEFTRGDFEASCRLLTRTVAETMKVARVSVWLLSPDRRTLRCATLFELDTGKHTGGERLTATDYPAYFAALEEGRAIAADDAIRDPRTREFADVYLKVHGISSLMDAMIRVSGEMVGVVCHEHVGEPRSWTRDEVTFAAEVADQASHAYLVAKNKAAETDRKRLEVELRQAHRLEAVGRLAGGVAHDFNNLLSVILGYAELGEETATGELHECFVEIRAAGRRAAELTSQLLSVGRKQVLRTRDVDLKELVENVLRLLRRAIPEDIELEFHPTDERTTVRVDTGRIEQALMNLCLNARDAIEGTGRITLTTTVEQQADSAWVVLSVEDDGVGIPQELLEPIFDPFFSTKEEGKGTGLGLSIVYGIATQHGGDVRVRSRPGKGSRFEIRLPRVEAGEEAPDEPLPVSGADEGDATPGHILVAEDAEPVGRLVQVLLEAAGYRVTVARDGVDVVEKFRERPGEFDLVVLDVVMPRCSGPAALEAIRAEDPGVPFVFTTGHGAHAVPRDLLARGGVEVLQKPYPSSELMAAVRRALGKRPMSKDPL